MNNLLLPIIHLFSPLLFFFSRLQLSVPSLFYQNLMNSNESVLMAPFILHVQSLEGKDSCLLVCYFIFFALFHVSLRPSGQGASSPEDPDVAAGVRRAQQAARPRHVPGPADERRRGRPASRRPPRHL